MQSLKIVFNVELLLHANRTSPSQGGKVHTTAAYLRRPKVDHSMQIASDLTNNYAGPQFWNSILTGPNRGIEPAYILLAKACPESFT